MNLTWFKRSLIKPDHVRNVFLIYVSAVGALSRQETAV